MNKFSTLSDFQRTQQNLLNLKRIKQIKYKWFSRINMIQDAIAECSNFEGHKSNTFLKDVKVVENLDVP